MMAKCKTIDRLELTRRNTRLLRNSNNTQDNTTPNSEIPDMAGQPEQVQHGEKCPKCGQYTLHHIEGCETCASCGYSACSYVW